MKFKTGRCSNQTPLWTCKQIFSGDGLDQYHRVDQENCRWHARKTYAAPYSGAAKRAKELFKGNRNKLFVAEAENCFIMYIRPHLGMRLSATTTDILPSPQALRWLTQFAGLGGEEGWFRRALGELPALHTHVDLMVEAGMHPCQKDSNNRVMDNEIMTAPLAYENVFVSHDKGIRHLLRNHKELHACMKCQYCEHLANLNLG